MLERYAAERRRRQRAWDEQWAARENDRRIGLQELY